MVCMQAYNTHKEIVVYSSIVGKCSLLNKNLFMGHILIQKKLVKVSKIGKESMLKTCIGGNFTHKKKKKPNKQLPYIPSFMLIDYCMQIVYKKYVVELSLILKNIH